jgi:hypothetical protein
VILDSNACPANPEETAEGYIMQTLTAEEAVAFEDHYVGCNRCAMVLQKAAEYIEAMRAAAESVRDKPQR